MDLRQFESELEALIGRPSHLRPFVCDGSPLTCSVFIVGANAATTMAEDFWDFWRPERGFDKPAWFESYKRNRAEEPLKPGKSRRSAVSPTRRIVDKIVQSALPVRCIETNVYSVPSASLHELPQRSRSTDVFDFLLASIRPRLLLVHGKDAVNHVSALAVEAEVMPEDHLSYRWSYAKAERVGRELRHRLTG